MVTPIIFGQQGVDIVQHIMYTCIQEMMARANSTYFKSTAENLSLGNAMVTFAIGMTVRRLTKEQNKYSGWNKKCLLPLFQKVYYIENWNSCLC